MADGLHKSGPVVGDSRQATKPNPTEQEKNIGNILRRGKNPILVMGKRDAPEGDGCWKVYLQIGDATAMIDPNAARAQAGEIFDYADMVEGDHPANFAG